jgi:hypothetical protein
MFYTLFFLLPCSTWLHCRISLPQQAGSSSSSSSSSSYQQQQQQQQQQQVVCKSPQAAVVAAAAAAAAAACGDYKAQQHNLLMVHHQMLQLDHPIQRGTKMRRPTGYKTARLLQVVLITVAAMRVSLLGSCLQPLLLG